MGLTKYKEKRDFKKSPEPQGGKPKKGELVFVVQKHAASHLHYDFRLEMEGVLKSWAVPKGPSLDPSVKRLAMMVEDHPYDYRNFEGVIPSGYGAGTVIVWDEGSYGPADTEKLDKGEADKELRRQLHSGKLKFVLKGTKLKGAWALVKAPARGENAWLLMKVKDKYASEKDVAKKDKSVISGKTLDEVKQKPDKFWESKSPGNKKKASPEEDLHMPSAPEPDLKQLLKKAPSRKFSHKIKPMLATLVDEAFDEPGWLYEVKWDGYRALAFIEKNKVDLLSRNQKSFNEKFYPLIPALRDQKMNAILDGEIVVVNESGVSDFGALQNWRSEDDGEIRLYLFDILWLDGKDLTSLPLIERRQILKSVITETETIRMSENFGDSATQFIEVARQMGLEGIIAKKVDSIYKPGDRSKDWLKIKATLRQEVVIGGYTKNEGSAKPFSSLLVGVYEGKELVYTGKVGTGFDVTTQKELLKKSRSLIIKRCPFNVEPDINKPSRFRPDPPKAKATWLKPELVCEVNYAEITSDGVMRHPSFVGMRTDKPAPHVTLEKALPSKKAIKKAQSKKIISAKGKKERKTLLNPSEETQVKTVNGHSLKFNNLGKVYWPEEGYTKRDLINYYYQVASYMVPYLTDRPQSMNRFPNGINGKSFYQKDVTGKAPSWVKTYLYHSEADRRDKHFLVCNNEASLLYMASLGCIEINPWSSRTKKPDHPDWCIIDLDPDKNTFGQVIEAALVTREILDGLGVPSFCKTSGSSGLHIYIPLGAKYTYEQSKEFARVIATMVHNEIPKFTSIERATRNRGGKMYIDFLQNRPQATVAAPYSVRPKPGATVSMPLHWEEVKKGLRMSDFTIANAIGRIKEMGDIFSPVLGKGIDLEKVVKQF
jgi:bifunctional non-homologous end joining protein LigD